MQKSMAHGISPQESGRVDRDVGTESALDELDLAIVNALQAFPRAPWNLVGSVVGVDPATTARRWARLRERGDAWIVTYPGNGRVQAYMAFVEISCLPGETGRVADALCEQPQIGTIEHTTGGRDLLLTVFIADLASLSRFVVAGPGSVPGVLSSRTLLLSKVITEGGRWRLDTIDAAAMDRLETARATAQRPEPNSRGSSPDRIEQSVREVRAAIGDDPRLSVSALARKLGCSERTANRQLVNALGYGDLLMRCEIARAESGWPVSATVWASVPADLNDQVSASVGALPETRLCVQAVGGAANLVFTVWLRTLADLATLEAQLVRSVPELRIRDSAVALRHVKRLGHVLDERGRSLRPIPVDY